MDFGFFLIGMFSFAAHCKRAGVEIYLKETDAFRVSERRMSCHNGQTCDATTLALLERYRKI